MTKTDAPVVETEAGTDTSVSTAVDTLLTNTREQMERELEELRPKAEAFHKLEAILANFDAISSGKELKSGSRAPRGSRSTEFVNIVRASGDEGVTVAEAAEHMPGINHNYLYRIAKDLTKAGTVIKDGKRYKVAEPTE